MRHKKKKSLGQHFLDDHVIIERIVKVIAPKPEDTVIEIGPGLGALTKPLLKLLNQLHVVEFDNDLIPVLKKMSEKIMVHHHDALTFDFSTLSQNNIRLIGNLPYNISTPLLFHFIVYIDIIKDMHFMMQKELVDRITATPGSKTYGRLSVMIQYYCIAEKCFDVPPEAFSPPPKVDSAVFRLIPKEERALEQEEEKTFATLVKQAFSQRRKTIYNVLKEMLTAKDWEASAIDKKARAETLALDDFIQLTRLAHGNLCDR
ncbi:MAG: 16S rRNA (adenine(1518)-N(6)/adenine(1519)-N(6))-dimethyltransferase RsmA [Gammaproteobacteria bacterium]